MYRFLTDESPFSSFFFELLREKRHVSGRISPQSPDSEKLAGWKGVWFLYIPAFHRTIFKKRGHS
jgi:hypothetical protein